MREEPLPRLLWFAPQLANSLIQLLPECLEGSCRQQPSPQAEKQGAAEVELLPAYTCEQLLTKARDGIQTGRKDRSWAQQALNTTHSHRPPGPKRSKAKAFTSKIPIMETQDL